jgi:hypothetical protein
VVFRVWGKHVQRHPAVVVVVVLAEALPVVNLSLILQQHRQQQGQGANHECARLSLAPSLSRCVWLLYLFCLPAFVCG